jgi:hypothetical protein
MAHGAGLDRIYDLLSVSIPESIMQSISQPDLRIQKDRPLHGLIYMY